MGGAVSTHSRLKAAAQKARKMTDREIVSTHSRLKAAARIYEKGKQLGDVSTHSRLKAAVAASVTGIMIVLFQHTAA